MLLLNFAGDLIVQEELKRISQVCVLCQPEAGAEGLRLCSLIYFRIILPSLQSQPSLITKHHSH